MDFLGTITHLFSSAAYSLWVAGQLLFLSATLFALLAVVLKGDEAIATARRISGTIRTNLQLAVVDAIITAPVLALLVQFIRTGVASLELHVISPATWTSFGLLP